MKALKNILLYCSCFSLFMISCAKKDDPSSSSATTDNTTTSSDNTTSSFSVSEITQTTGNGYKIGSFVVPSNGLSFTLSIFSDNNSLVYFASLTDPDASNLLDNTSTPNIYAQTSGFGALSYMVEEVCWFHILQASVPKQEHGHSSLPTTTEYILDCEQVLPHHPQQFQYNPILQVLPGQQVTFLPL